MHNYRVYVLSPGGKIMRGEWLEADNEHEAKARVLKLCRPGDGGVELWSGGQRLAQIACACKLPKET